MGRPKRCRPALLLSDFMLWPAVVSHYGWDGSPAINHGQEYYARVKAWEYRLCNFIRTCFGCRNENVTIKP